MGGLIEDLRYWSTSFIYSFSNFHAVSLPFSIFTISNKPVNNHLTFTNHHPNDAHWLFLLGNKGVGGVNLH